LKRKWSLDYVPRKVDDDCYMELRWMYGRRDLSEVHRDLAVSPTGEANPKLTDWVEANIEETLTYFRLPLALRQAYEAPDILERL
jgi:transposase-like protein